MRDWVGVRTGCGVGGVSGAVFFCCKNSRRDMGLKLGAESLLMVYTSPLFSKFPSDIINLLLDH